MAVAISTLSSPDYLAVWQRFGWGLLYFSLYIYQFCLPNQIFGLKEDRLNKPFRPLPSGLVTLSGAKIRWIVSIFLYLALGSVLNILEWTILWITVSIYLNCTSANKSWLTKNLLPMGLGILAQLAAAWEIITPLTLLSWHWILYLAGWGALTSSTQDFRDIAGDRMESRNTLPIAFGEQTARAAMTFLWMIMAGVTHLVLFHLIDYYSHIVLAVDLGLVIYHLYIAWRISHCKTPHEDQMTYRIYTYLYCVLLAVSFLVIGG